MRKSKWFRAVREWLSPTCLQCGGPVMQSVRHRPQEQFCSERCATEWERFSDERWL